MYKVIIDTNILISAHLKPQSLPRLVLRAVLRKYVQLYVSNAILKEYERVLRYPKLKFSPKDVQAIMSMVKRHSRSNRPKRVEEALVNDPDDLKFIACAMAAKADFIVTGDKRAYRYKQYEGVRVVSAREFIGEIGLELATEI